MANNMPQGPPQPGFVPPNTEMAMSNEEASAPPLHELSVPFGYENASFTAAVLPPPMPPVDSYNAANVHRTIPNLAVVREEEIRSALDDFLSDHCCYGSKPAKDLQIRDIIMRSSFQYKLETFTERRETKWKFEPYKGQPIDGPNNGRSPDPWQIFVPPVAPFENGSKKMEVPHSAIVKNCHNCGGGGRIRCRSCTGYGGSHCTWCNGRGTRDDGRCFHCSGTGRSRCISCQGHGQVKCNTCKGHGQLKCFIQLTVHWTNHIDDYVSDETGLSEDLIKNATGSVAFDERYPQVYPLNNFPDERISRASKGLIQKHHTSFTMERILEQRHKVMLIPVAVVYYKWEQKDGCFYVYGLEHKVCFDDYPQQCCWGVCTIL